MESSSLEEQVKDCANIISELKYFSNSFALQIWYLLNDKLLISLLESFKSLESEFTIEQLHNILKNLFQNCNLKFANNLGNLVNLDQIFQLLLKFLFANFESENIDKDKMIVDNMISQQSFDDRINFQTNKELSNNNQKDIFNHFHFNFNKKTQSYSFTNLQNNEYMSKINFLKFIINELLDYIQKNNYTILDSSVFNTLNLNSNDILNSDINNLRNFIQILKVQIKKYKDIVLQYIDKKFEADRINIIEYKII